MWYIYTVEYYSAMRMEILPFVTTWMDLESTMLSEIKVRQRKTNTVWFHLYVESKKQMNKHNKIETVIETENQQVVTRGENGEERKEIGKGD